MADVSWVVEDGTGISNATSYVTLEYIKQFFFDEGYANTGDIPDSDFKRYANKATRYIDASYQRSFPGYPQYDDQKLLWPRSGAYYLSGYSIGENVIPSEVKDAVCQSAYLIYSGTDFTETISKSGHVKSSRVKVDVIEEEVEYVSSSTMYSDVYPVIDQALAKICGGTSDRFALKITRVGGDSP